MRLKKTFGACLLIFVMLLTTAGCSVRNMTPKEPFIMVESLDAEQYKLFLNREISVCINAINTVELEAMSLADGTSSLNNVKAACNSALEKLQSSSEQIKKMTPAPQYEETYDTILSLLGDAIDHITDLKALTDGTGETTAQKIIDNLASDYLALTGQFDNYYN